MVQRTNRLLCIARAFVFFSQLTCTWVFVVGYKTGRSLLIDDGALPWIVANANNDASPIRRHIELALCHLAQHGDCFSQNLYDDFNAAKYIHDENAPR